MKRLALWCLAGPVARAAAAALFDRLPDGHAVRMPQALPGPGPYHPICDPTSGTIITGRDRSVAS